MMFSLHFGAVFCVVLFRPFVFFFVVMFLFVFVFGPGSYPFLVLCFFRVCFLLFLLVFPPDFRMDFYVFWLCVFGGVFDVDWVYLRNILWVFLPSPRE